LPGAQLDKRTRAICGGKTGHSSLVGTGGSPKEKIKWKKADTKKRSPWKRSRERGKAKKKNQSEIGNVRQKTARENFLRKCQSESLPDKGHGENGKKVREGKGQQRLGKNSVGLNVKINTPSRGVRGGGGPFLIEEPAGDQSHWDG